VRHALSVLAVSALAIAPACSTPRREPLPLDTPEVTSTTHEHPTPSSDDRGGEPPIQEEILAEAPPQSGPTDQPETGSATTAAEAAATTPNAVAATRLVDAARTAMAAGDSAGALDRLERAIALDPDNAYAYYSLAELHFAHRSFDQAIAFAERAAALSSTQSPTWSSRAYTLQGNALEAVGRFADARSAYARAAAIAPDNLAAQAGLARLGGAGEPAP
jgi:tetratricopeptide (TPR) repeat protein